MNAEIQNTGIPASSRGMILQRGGQELLLSKVNDRFTVRPATLIEPKQLSLTFLGAWRHSIPKAQLELFTVAPTQLDVAMSQARASRNVSFASHVYQLGDNTGAYVYLTDQITVLFAPWVDDARINTIAMTYGLVKQKIIPDLPHGFVFLVNKQADENPIKIANQLMAIPEVITAEANIVIQQEAHYKPRDPLYPQQWYLNHSGGNQLALASHISIEKAWDITRGVRSIVVAVTDDSFDLNHPDFQGTGKVVAPRDLKERDFLPLPEEKETSHGTACAGLAIAEENGTGIAGVAPGCAFMPIRTTGYLDDDSVDEIFDWAVDNGASVISCSWGASSVKYPLSLRQSTALNRAATKGRNGKGCVIVFAAGNANRPIDGTVMENNWPKNVLKGDTQWLSGFALHPDVIAVSASTSLNKKAAYSNWGQNISVCAPSNNAPPGIWFPETDFIYTQPAINTTLSGLGMLTTDQIGAAGYTAGDFTNNFGGTSSATPVVAGVAALILSANPDLTARQVKSILHETADKIIDSDPDVQFGLREGTYDSNGHCQWFGYGKVNAAKAVQAAQMSRKETAIAIREIGGQNYNKQNIPDNDRQGVKSIIDIQDSGTLKDIKVTVNINHDYLGDLEIYLIAPNNQQILLQSRTLGRRSNLKNTYTLNTHSTLKRLLSASVKGSWQLWIVDLVPEDTGILNYWELVIGI